MSGKCLTPSAKKALLEALENKCPIDESEVCKDIISLVDDWPECGGERKARTRHAPPVRVDVEVGEEGPEERPRSMRGPRAMEAPAKRIKRPHALSEYQKHQSVCILKEGFTECVQKWRKGESMASQYRGSGMTK